MSTNETATINLGQEYDAALIARLRGTVSACGGTMSESFYGVGGSQEVIRYDIVLPGGVLQLESETYIGLTLSGPSALMNQVVHILQSA